MPPFSPDMVLPHDAAGWGRWLGGHSIEHGQFANIASTLTPPAIIPAWDIFSWSDEPLRSVFWKNVHQTIHVALRQQSGVSGIDLSLIDFNNDADFLVWQNDHATEHAQLRAYYGVI